MNAVVDVGSNHDCAAAPSGLALQFAHFVVWSGVPRLRCVSLLNMQEHKTPMSKYQFSCQVQPQALPDQSDVQAGVYAFAYTITIKNTGTVAAQLIARHWLITDANGHTEEVKGLGVVGRQPLLQPGEAFEYTSGAHLRTPTGLMRGWYFMVAVDGERFETDIPPLVLDATDSTEGMPKRVLH
jgi:ApaG protein